MISRDDANGMANQLEQLAEDEMPPREAFDEAMRSAATMLRLLGDQTGSGQSAADKLAVQQQLINELSELLEGLIKASAEEDVDLHEELIEQAKHKLKNAEDMIEPSF